MFDVDAYRAAHRPWEFRHQGRTFIARHVSAPDCQRFDGWMATATRERQRQTAIRWILRRAFPWRPSYLLRGDPVRILLALEPAERMTALRDFFGRLRGESPVPPQSPRMNGMRSPGRTPSRTM
jgi:hypothetical protein